MSQMIESFMNGAAEQAPRLQPIVLDEAPQDGQPGAAVQPAANPLHAVKVQLQVCVGRAQMSVGQLLGAREHEVLVLDREVEQPVDLLLEGRVVARGQLVAVDGRFGVRVTELPLPLKF
ncbi:FliM/FliN family flagellar motor switch protein [Ramlibacter humi]|uniref:Flagellar motor switch protein FliN n=1 Tax=Ramlibacter humi TaxID=2530451 RepID=A0A4Z0BG19_9BURK|nr:FliM/FliN family flagellar motor switch protein [Ramlibacter humi]TFY97074.1 flagellar motor switch protein [Ramlibacter humi]